MSDFVFGKTSEARLQTMENDLQKVYRLALKRSRVDFGIAEGHRSVERQQKLYAQGRTEPGVIVTHVDGINKTSKHNVIPSKAGDIYAWVNGRASWDAKHLCYLAGVIQAAADELGVPIRWGGNWDSDGEIISDQNFIDLPHHELQD